MGGSVLDIKSLQCLERQRHRGGVNLDKSHITDALFYVLVNFGQMSQINYCGHSNKALVWGIQQRCAASAMHSAKTSDLFSPECKSVDNVLEARTELLWSLL